jgi:hypothetical protein
MPVVTLAIWIVSVAVAGFVIPKLIHRQRLFKIQVQEQLLRRKCLLVRSGFVAVRRFIEALSEGNR